MTNRKKILGIVGIVVVVVLAIFIGPFVARMPSPQADRIDGTDFVGIDSGGSFAWVIPTETGVVLVDVGMDADGKALKEEVGDRKVHAILVSHGHFDHIAGLPLFPEAMVYVGPGERVLATGEGSSGSFMANMAGTMMGQQPYTPPKLTEFTDGDIIEIDGERFQAIHVYGHTKGSAMYLWKDILFTGDSIVGRDGYVNEIPALLYTDYDAVRGNVAKVLDYEFERIADGHVGLHTTNARQQVISYVGQ